MGYMAQSAHKEPSAVEPRTVIESRVSKGTTIAALFALFVTMQTCLAMRGTWSTYSRRRSRVCRSRRPNLTSTPWQLVAAPSSHFAQVRCAPAL